MWDKEYGGCIATLDRSGNALSPYEKAVVQHAQTLHAVSNWYSTRDSTSEVSTLAQQLYDYLNANFSKAMVNGTEYRLKLSRSGVVLDDTTPVHVQAQVIQALLSYATAFDVAAAETRALSAFASVDARSYDSVAGYYDDATELTTIIEPATRSGRTQRHMLSALLDLYRVTNDSTMRTRAQDLTLLIVDRMIGKSAQGSFIFEQFDAQWNWVHPEESHPANHDIALQTAGLLMDAVRLLPFNSNRVQQIESVAVDLIDSAISMGFDHVYGGFMTETDVDDDYPLMHDKAKLWRVQTEAVHALWRAYQLTGSHKYVEVLESTLTWIETKQRDLRPSGTEWFTSVDANGIPLDTTKGSASKTALTTTFPLLDVADAITATRPPISA